MVDSIMRLQQYTPHKKYQAQFKPVWGDAAKPKLRIMVAVNYTDSRNGYKAADYFSQLILKEDNPLHHVKISNISKHGKHLHMYCITANIDRKIVYDMYRGSKPYAKRDLIPLLQRAFKEGDHHLVGWAVTVNDDLVANQPITYND